MPDRNVLNKYNCILLSLNLLIGSQRNVDFWYFLVSWWTNFHNCDPRHMSLNTGEILCGMITLSLVLYILKLHRDAVRLQQECDYINKTVSGANGFELPHNNTSWIFNTWDFLWDSHSILLIYKKKQIACVHNQATIWQGLWAASHGRY